MSDIHYKGVLGDFIYDSREYKIGDDGYIRYIGESYKPTFLKGCTNYAHMFEKYNYFKIDLSNWDTTGVTNMSHMFYRSILTTINVGDFNTSEVKDMSYMFGYIPASRIYGLKFLDTSKVINMRGMFSCSRIQQINLENWDTSNLEDIERMFYYCNYLLYIIGFDKLNLSKVKYMDNLYYNHITDKSDISLIYEDYTIKFKNTKGGDWVFLNGYYYLQVRVNANKCMDAYLSNIHCKFRGLINDLCNRSLIISGDNSKYYSSCFKKIILEEFECKLLKYPHNEIINSYISSGGVLKIPLDELESRFNEFLIEKNALLKPNFCNLDIIGMDKPDINGNFVAIDIIMVSDYDNKKVREYYINNKKAILEAVKLHYNSYKNKYKKFLPLNYYKIGDVSATQGSLRITLELKEPLMNIEKEMEEEIQNTN